MFRMSFFYLIEDPTDKCYNKLWELKIYCLWQILLEGSIANCNNKDHISAKYKDLEFEIA